MGNQLAGKKALITGGGSGIGRAIAAAFSAAGAIVAILGRSEKVIEAAAALGDTVYPYQADIVDAASIRKAIAKIGQDMGPVDILVNNAGMSHLCRFLDLSSELIEQHYRTNVLGAVYCTQLVLPYMMRQHFGRIINMKTAQAAGVLAAAATWGFQERELFLSFGPGFVADHPMDTDLEVHIICFLT